MSRINLTFLDSDKDVGDILSDIRKLCASKAETGHVSKTRSGQVLGLLHELMVACLALPSNTPESLGSVVETLMMIIEDARPFESFDERYVSIKEKALNVLCRLLNEAKLTDQQPPGDTLDNFRLLVKFFSQAENVPNKTPSREWVIDFLEESLSHMFKSGPSNLLSEEVLRELEQNGKEYVEPIIKGIIYLGKVDSLYLWRSRPGVCSVLKPFALGYCAINNKGKIHKFKTLDQVFKELSYDSIQHKLAHICFMTQKTE